MTKFIMATIGLFLSISLNAQVEIQGRVIDQQTKETLPFASVHISNTLKGTVTNEKGHFNLMLPKGLDTIEVSYMGYSDKVVVLSERKERALTISLEQWQYELAEVVVRPQSPLEYIRGAIKKFPTNISRSPFKSTMYFLEKATMENDKEASYKKNEAIFSTYYEDYADTIKKSKNRLNLYEKDEKGSFRSMVMDNKRVKMIMEKEREENGEAEDGEEEEDMVIKTPMDGGPQSVLDAAQTIISFPFLQEKNFKRIKFSFGEPSYYKNRELIVIRFMNKRKIDHSYYDGAIYLDINNLAIVAVNYTERVKIPFYVNPLLRSFLGFRIKDIQMKVSLNNQELNDLWYPKEILADIQLKLKEKDQVETINIMQLLSVSNIEIDNPEPILKEHEFNSENDIEKQIFNIEGLSWKDVNRLQ